MAFCLIPYHACSCSSIPVTQLIKHEDLVQIYMDKDQVDKDRAKVEEQGSDRILRSGHRKQ